MLKLSDERGKALGEAQGRAPHIEEQWQVIDAEEEPRAERIGLAREDL